MACSGCGNLAPSRTSCGFAKNEQGEREYYEFCNQCGSTPSVTVNDVFWDGTPEHGLSDDPQTGKPRVFGSKAEKAAFLRANNLVEAGDHIRGAKPVITQQEQPKQNNPRSVEEALAQVKSMGRDRRRQEYLKILHNAEKARHG